MIYIIQRFPKPEFETGYVQPETWLPMPRAGIWVWLDVMVLLAALSVAAWLVLKKRSRMGVFLLSIFSLVYFGFYREGCVCSVGSIQNVTLGLFSSQYIVPLTVIIFFLAPLVFTLLFGRGFCAGVCPFGALQDLVAFKPMRMGVWLNSLLGMIPYLYLGLAVLLAATGCTFIICRYDPFVGIFRLNASFGMLLFAGVLLFTGIFIARPYCRFLCPYGVLLNWMSRFSFRHMTITPASCIQCRLCENSCPYDAIDFPLQKGDPAGRKKQVFRLGFLITLLPFLVGFGALLGNFSARTFAGTHPKVRLLTLIQMGEDEKNGSVFPELTAFKSSGITLNQLETEVAEIREKVRIGSRIYGGFIGLTFALTLIGLARTKYRNDYVPDRANCFSCGKCMDYCPVGMEERKANAVEKKSGKSSGREEE